MNLRRHPTKQVTVILIVTLEGGIVCLLFLRQSHYVALAVLEYIDQVGLQVTVISLTLQPLRWD